MTGRYQVAGRFHHFRVAAGNNHLQETEFVERAGQRLPKQSAAARLLLYTQGTGRTRPMILGMTYYQICMYFLIYSFAGWCLEVIYHALKLGKIVNRGFLNGPVCPVYGFGMLAICAMIHFLPKNSSTGEYPVWAVFLGGMALTTAVEFVAGFLLYHLFHTRWWDYSALPFNIGGYICPLFSVLWGIACVIVVRYVHPLVVNAAGHGIPEKYGWPVMAVLYLIYLIDFIVTVLTVTGMNRELDELDKIRSAMRGPSDRMSEMLGKGTIDAARTVDEQRVQASLARAELRDNARQAKLAAGEALLNAKERQQERREDRNEAAAAMRERYEELRADFVSHPYTGKGRLLRAFPDMVSRDHDDLIKELQEQLKKL